jgi:hypothetical protein
MVAFCSFKLRLTVSQSNLVVSGSTRQTGAPRGCDPDPVPTDRLAVPVRDMVTFPTYDQPSSRPEGTKSARDKVDVCRLCAAGQRNTHVIAMPAHNPLHHDVGSESVAADPSPEMVESLGDPKWVRSAKERAVKKPATTAPSRSHGSRSHRLAREATREFACSTARQLYELLDAEKSGATIAT